MKYEKPALSFDEQADKILGRGLVADRSDLIARLKVTNYYRLSSYLFPFRDGVDSYRPGTTLESILRLYDFDQCLRNIVLDAVESIEVQVRTQLTYHFAHAHGPFSYLDSANFPNFNPIRGDFGKWEKKLKEQMERGKLPKGKEDFVLHFYKKYGDEEDRLPIWMIVELMDFGSTLSFFRGVSDPIRKAVSASIGQPEEVVFSWLLALNSVRNRCAHHARLWNWTIGYPVLIPQPKKFPEWHVLRMRNDRLGILLTICRYWLDRISLKQAWGSDVMRIFDNYPEISPADLGLPPTWREHPIWNTQVNR
ncbi:MAG: Abi family protein [Spirochaetes bacterium]|nr:Abi family protein [Spirochaetota bacterium]